MTAAPMACAECLRRSWLLSLLGPYVERLAGPAGSPAPDLLRLANEDLVATAAPKVASQLLARIDALTWSEMRDELDGAECWASCRHDSRFPAALRGVPDAPWALIGRGNPALLEDLAPAGAVTVVGARRATSYGREVARELGRELAGAGALVVSGLAFGIDACAHRGALEAGTTVAVLGCGSDTAYPAAHRSLWRQVCEEGAVVSELPPGAPPWRWTFPARNRIMAALAGMTIVVEAADRSGSLVTADVAADLGRDVGAVPGPVNSRASSGPNGLLAGGARLVRDAQDVLDTMLGAGARRVAQNGPSLDVALLDTLGAVVGGASSCDAVAAALGMPPAGVSAALARLEMLGYVSCSPVGAYRRTTLRPPAAVGPPAECDAGPEAS